MTETDQPRLSSLQQERSRQTRRALVRSAERLWRTKGFDETTVSDVCDLAGVAKGTFYFYFPHKEDLLIELGLNTSEHVFQETARAAASDVPTEEALRTAIGGIARRVERTAKPLLMRTLIELYRRADRWGEVRGERHDFGNSFERIFRTAMERGEIPRRYDPRELGAVLGSAIMNGMLAWAADQTGPLTLEQVLWRRTRLILDGASVRV